jgi:hypothetical protein
MQNIISKTGNIDSDLSINTFLDEVPLITFGDLHI